MTGRSSPIVAVARMVQQLPLGWLHHLEKPMVSTHQGEPRPVFLIALPRSGSTLAYQALVHATDSLYLSNLWNFLYCLPWAGGRIAGKRCAGHVSDFRSRQGFVGGVCGPAEGLRFWSYWTGHGLGDVQNAALAACPRRQARVDHLRHVLAALERQGRPFISGYIGHSLVVRELSNMFPGALFVRLKRDPVDNALSILRILLEEGRDEFSVLPADLGLPVDAGIHDRVAAQVAVLNRRVDAELDDGRTVTVSYEDLCSDPSREIQRVIDFCRTRGVLLRTGSFLPASFERRDTSGEWLDHQARLQQAFARRTLSGVG